MTHIIAISGFNIAILTGLLLAASRPLFGLRWSAWFVLLGIGFYTVLVGADAAVVRAAIMGALLVIATRLLGRPTFAPVRPRLIYSRVCFKLFVLKEIACFVLEKVRF